MIERYYNLFDPAKHYTQLLFRAGDGLQSRELNEIQTTLIHRLQGVADALLKDGDIVSGANLQIDADTGLVTLEAGRVYLRGAVREVPATTFTVPTSGRIAVGVRFTTRTVTELEDPQPARAGRRRAQLPGAGGRTSAGDACLGLGRGGHFGRSARGLPRCLRVGQRHP